MKIAIATDDGKTIGRHFGRARVYAVLTVQDGTVTYRELRDKSAPHWQTPDPAHSAPYPAHGTTEGGAHGTGAHGTEPAAAAKHAGMFEAISDCDCLIAGGMGRGAYDHATVAGIRPFVTSLVDIEQAAIDCASGRLLDESARLH